MKYLLKEYQEYLATQDLEFTREVSGLRCELTLILIAEYPSASLGHSVFFR